jgi:HPt (histidine-containing phosphotransfer) domain-containing protein
MRRQSPVPAPDGAFDADAVWTLFEGRTDRMLQVWKISRSTLPGYMDGLTAAVESGDWQTAARHAHSLAGSAANFGAHALVTTARRIEDLAGAGPVPVAEVSEARAHFDALCTAMSSWLDRVAGGAGASAAGQEDPSRR